MADVELWIEVVNWERYQHRDTARSGVPPWIKLETSLLSSPDFVGLSHGDRGVLVSLWVEYARSQRRLSGDAARLSRALGVRTTSSQLQRLSDAGFIRLVARRPSRVMRTEKGEGEDLSKAVPYLDTPPGENRTALDIIIDPSTILREMP